MSDLLHRIRYFLTHRFNLQKDRAEELTLLIRLRKTLISGA